MAVRETDTGRHDLVKLPFSGYHSRAITEPDALLTETGPGTPMGEYFRRAWLPICLSEHLTDLPKAVRTLGEDLVAFRDKSGQIGVLHRHCSHRGTSLEYGIVSECGIRCCYHGWLFDVDGTILETPGEPPDSKLKDGLFHGAYPAFELHGMVWAYMGPPELVPDKPHLDVFEVPGSSSCPSPCPTRATGSIRRKTRWTRSMPCSCTAPTGSTSRIRRSGWRQISNGGSRVTGTAWSTWRCAASTTSGSGRA